MMKTSTMRQAVWHGRALLAALTFGALAGMSALAHATPKCTQWAPAAPSIEEQMRTLETWGPWRSYEERFVRLDGAAAPVPTYHTLLKRKPGPVDTSKPLILFLHGVPEFARSWEKWMDVIGEKHDVMAIDFKGFGDSSRPMETKAYDVFRTTAEIHDVVACLGYRKVIPVGHDWGGAVAWSYGLFYPLQTQALVVLSTPHPYTYFRELAKRDSPQSRQSVYIDLIRKNTPEATAQAKALMNSYIDDLLQPYYAGLRAQRLLDTNMATDWHWDRMFGLYRAMPFYPPSALMFSEKPNLIMKTVMTVRVPTLAFYGADDAFFHKESWRGVEELVPRLTFEVLPGQGHFLNHTVPELPAKVLDFIDKHVP